MTISPEPPRAPDRTLLIIGPDPAPAALRGPLDALRRSGFELQWAGTPVVPGAGGEPSPSEAALLVAESLDARTLEGVEALLASGHAVLLITSRLSDEQELAALRSGASECLPLENLDEARLLQAVRRMLARATHAGHASRRAVLFRTLVERDADGLVILDRDGMIRYASEAGAALIGLTPDKLVGRSGFELVHPDDAERTLDGLSRAIADPCIHVFETLRLRHADGHWLELDCGVVSLLEDPAVRGLVVTSRGSTEQRRQERERYASDLRLREFAEHAPVQIWMEDAERRLVWENATSIEFTGQTWEQEKDYGWLDTVHPDDRQRVEEHYRQTSLEQRGFTLEFRMRRHDGVYRHLLQIAIPRWAPNGELAGFLGVDMDVSEIKEASLRLEETETRYRNFIEHSTEGIWRFENETPIPIDMPEQEQIEQFLHHSYLAECNVAMAMMYGYERPEELIGRKLRDFIPPGEPTSADAFLLAFIRSGYRLTDAESHENDRHGRSRFFLNNLVGVVENGCLVRSWGTQRDITERRQLEEEARQARKMETAGRLAGGIAHDFNNLLTAILGTSEILLQELPPGAPERNDVEEIKRAATRAANLTRQLLAFSRRQVLQPRILDVGTVVQGVETMLRRLIGEHILLQTRTASGLWRVRADPGQLEQVILNLCVNARDAMPTGGTILIEAENHQFEGTTIAPESVMPPGDYVRLTVSDTGTGMDPETQRHLFEPFFTTKEPGKGTGLGLATVYGIVKQSGGFIYAQSERGRGSHFRIFLPRVSGAPELNETHGPVTPPPAAEGTLLLVEDEESVRRLARRVLEGVGYRVLEAASGAEALRIVEGWEGPLDLVITDVIMPGMSGQELSARLRERRPSLRILYVSGYTDDAILQHGTLLPNTGFLQKPFTPGTLAQRVREVMGY